MNNTPRFIAALALAGALVTTSASATEAGPYIRLENGVSSISGSKLSYSHNGNSAVAQVLDLDNGSMKVKFKPGYVFGGATGYRFNESLAAEIELDHSQNKIDTVDGNTVTESIKLKQTSLLANGVYSAKLGQVVTLSLGAGAGVQFCSNNMADESYTDTGVVSGVTYTGKVSGKSKSDAAFLAQLKSGVSFALTQNFTFDAGYKLRFVSANDIYDVSYSATGGGNSYNGTIKTSLDSRFNHVFSAGFTFSF